MGYPCRRLQLSALSFCRIQMGSIRSVRENEMCLLCCSTAAATQQRRKGAEEPPPQKQPTRATVNRTKQPHTQHPAEDNEKGSKRQKFYRKEKEGDVISRPLRKNGYEQNPSIHLRVWFIKEGATLAQGVSWNPVAKKKPQPRPLPENSPSTDLCYPRKYVPEARPARLGAHWYRTRPLRHPRPE